MNVPLYGIIGAAVTLTISIFGVWTIIKVLICLIAIGLGIITCVYRTYQKNVENEVNSEKENFFEKTEKLRQLILDETKKKMTFTLDRRVTGSHIIDESLQEILDFVIRDYVEPWYGAVTDDDEFIHSVRDTAQKIAINVANRVKDVDWVPYLTTRLVDDAASHMRLYRQADARLKELQGKRMEKRGQSSSTIGGTPKKIWTHRRNKSETDVSGYSHSKFYVPHLASSTEAIERNEDKETLEKIFFDLEVVMENNLISRDLVCTDESHELTFLGEVAEILLYLLLPKADFECLTVRFILRELLVNVIIRPLLDLFSDPDYINQTFIWLCTKEMSLPCETFLTVIRLSDSVEELMATRNLVCKEISHLRSKDSGGEDDLNVKQQLNSLLYVKRILDSRIIGMREGLDSELDSIGVGHDWNRILLPSNKLINIPLDELLKNNIALSYLIDYMTAINAESYLFFYLNVYGWRVTAEQQISDIELQKLDPSASETSVRRSYNDLENLKEAAIKIYQQYLGERAPVKLQLNEATVKGFLTKVRTEQIKETWFDDLQSCCYEKLQNDDKFLPSFKRSASYVKLLAELDLLKDPISEEDSKSLDSISVSSMNNELDKLDELSESPVDEDSGESCAEGVKTDKNDEESYDAVDDVATEQESSAKVRSNLESSKESLASVNSGESSSELGQSSIVKLDPQNLSDQSVIKKLQQSRFEISARIIETGIVSDRGKTYGVYALSVTKSYETGYQEKWHIYRRYSDFYDLQQRIKLKYYDLAKLAFPAKKTFHNMERVVLEKRMSMLNSWLQQLMRPTVVSGHIGLQNLLLSFLEQGDYDKGVTGGHVSRTIDTLVVNPLKTSMKTVTQAVKTMPDNMLNTVDGVMDNISKLFGNPKKPNILLENAKVGAGLDTETDDNIPLRIILLLMDEVFDLKVRNQWLRRRIVTLLRQIIRTMFGDIVNRRIVEYVSLLTTPSNVAKYLRQFKHSFWPNGVKVETRPPRDFDTKNRTRVAAKVALLSCLSDELKHIIGSETTRSGLLRVFELFQRPVLNRRLLYVFLEGVIENLFPQTDFLEILRKLYSDSPRVEAYKRNSGKS